MGYNIWSGSSEGNGLAAALTNPTCISRRKCTIVGDYPVEFAGREWPDAETAYLTLTSSGKTLLAESLEGGRGVAERDSLMVRIIVAKLRQHPRLGRTVAKLGGVAFLASCTHYTGARTERFRKWEGAGRESRFVRNLISAFEEWQVRPEPAGQLLMVLPEPYSGLDGSRRRALRERYVRAQDGLCFFCHAPLTGPPTGEFESFPVDWSLFPPDFLRHPVHLQHCHVTDLTEGAVHARCNAVAWVRYGR